MSEADNRTRSSGSIAPPPAMAGDDPWPQLWFSIARREWRTLAIVPSHADTGTAFVAKTLADVGGLYEEFPVLHLAAEHIPPAGVRDMLQTLSQRSAKGLRTVISLGSPLLDHSAIPLARAADAVIMLAPLGVTVVSDARKAIGIVGRDRFMGSIAVDAPATPAP